MGFNKAKRRIRRAIDGWNCVGFFGYGHGRAAAVYGEDFLCGKSVCQDICKKVEECRRRHHLRMDSRYPQLCAIVAHAAKLAVTSGGDVNAEILSAMERATILEVEEAQEILQINRQFDVNLYTDHYRTGQFENIQNGIDRLVPTNKRPVPVLEQAGGQDVTA